MAKRKIRVWFFSLHLPYKCQPQIRFLGPASYLPKDKFEIIYAPSLKAMIKMRNIPDIIIFHRNFYDVNEVALILKFAKSNNIKTIMDLDDLITDIPEWHPLHNDYQNIKEAELAIFKGVTAITVTNEELKAYYRAYNKNIFVLPNLLDDKIWHFKFRPPSDSEKIIIGYSGTPTHIYDFEPVIPALKYVAEKFRQKISFRFFGYVPDQMKNMKNVEYIPLIENYEKFARNLYLADLSFVIAPLRNNFFNSCKSNIKYQEYSACSYPGIYSAAGAYRKCIKHEQTGLLTENSERAWIHALEKMISDYELRLNIAKKAYTDVKENFSMKKNARRWGEFYERLLAEVERKDSPARLSKEYRNHLIYSELRKNYWILRKKIKLWCQT